MANDCTTEIRFYGEETALNDFLKRVEYAISKKRHPDKDCWDRSWLGNVTEEFGIDFEKEDIFVRGSITDIVDDTIYTDTAWTPALRIWSAIIEKCYSDEDDNPLIGFDWIAEEEDGGLYMTDDIGWFGTDYYHVEWCIGEDEDYEGEYFDNPDEVAEHINGLIAKCDLEIDLITEKDINAADDEGRNIYLRGDDWYIVVIILEEANDNDVE